MDELSNEVTIGAFALLVQDLLRLFQAMNEGVINVLRRWLFVVALLIMIIRGYKASKQKRKADSIPWIVLHHRALL